MYHPLGCSVHAKPSISVMNLPWDLGLAFKSLLEYIILYIFKYNANLFGVLYSSWCVAQKKFALVEFRWDHVFNQRRAAV